MPTASDHPDPKEATEAKLCAYLEGELAPADRAEIERHLAANPQHKTLLAELAKTRQWVRNLPKVRAPVDLAESFHGQIERQMLLDQSPLNAPVRRWPQWWLAAAVVGLILGLGALITLMLSPPGRGSGVAVNGTSTTPAGTPIGTPTGTPVGSTSDGASRVPPASLPVESMANGVPAAVVAHADETAPPAGVAPSPMVPDREAPAIPTAVAEKSPAPTSGPAADTALAAATPWTPPPSAFDVPHSNRTFYLVVQTADTRATERSARNYFQSRSIANSSEPEPITLAMRSRNGNNFGAGSDSNAVRRQTNSNSTQALMAQVATTTTAPTTEASTGQLAGYNLTRAQIDELAAAVSAGGANSVKVMVPGDKGYLDESDARIARGRSLLVVIPQLDKPGVEKTNIVKVADDGTVSLPMIEPVAVDGLSSKALSRRIADRYHDSNVIARADVAVTVLPADELQTTRPTTAATTEPAGYTVIVVAEPR